MPHSVLLETKSLTSNLSRKVPIPEVESLYSGPKTLDY